MTKPTMTRRGYQVIVALCLTVLAIAGSTASANAWSWDETYGSQGGFTHSGPASLWVDRIPCDGGVTTPCHGLRASSRPTIWRQQGTTGAQPVAVIYQLQEYTNGSWVVRASATEVATVPAGYGGVNMNGRVLNYNALRVKGYRGFWRLQLAVGWYDAQGRNTASAFVSPSQQGEIACLARIACTDYGSYVNIYSQTL